MVLYCLYFICFLLIFLFANDSGSLLVFCFAAVSCWHVECMGTMYNLNNDQTKGTRMENFIAWAINNPMDFAIPFSAFSLVVVLILFYLLTFVD